jgi:hypothetical protein
MSEEYVEAYFITSKGTALNQETYWRISSDDWPDFYLRFVEIEDSPGGFGAIVQDSTGFSKIHPTLFDQDYIAEITDPEELALAMLAVHG